MKKAFPGPQRLGTLLLNLLSQQAVYMADVNLSYDVNNCVIIIVVVAVDYQAYPRGTAIISVSVVLILLLLLMYNYYLCWEVLWFIVLVGWFVCSFVRSLTSNHWWVLGGVAVPGLVQRGYSISSPVLQVLCSICCCTIYSSRQDLYRPACCVGLCLAGSTHCDMVFLFLEVHL